MRVGICAIAAMIIGVVVLATGQARAQSSGPVYQSSRYDDDFRYLRAPGHPTDFWDPIKDIQFENSLGSYLSLGGEFRERFETYADPLFGLKRQGSDTYLLHRILVHADLHVSDNLRGFVQLGSELETGKNQPLSPTDQDRLDLQQGFIEARAPVSGAPAPSLRAGRQEMVFGSQRLVGVREGTNVRRSFDGFRGFDTLGDVRLDLFATRPVRLRQGVFDDQPDHAQAFWGAYATAPVGFLPPLKMDLYYLGYENDLARFGGLRGEERRHSLGTRLFGAAADWDWNVEGLGQFGHFGNRDIRAWTVASDTGRTLPDIPWQPRLGLKANVASGDHNPRGGTLGTFNPLFPKLPYFNEATLIVPSNFFDIYPSVTVRPTTSLSITLGWDFLWRESKRDAVYASPFTAIAGTAQANARRIGDQIALEAQWQADAHLAFTGSLVRFNAGPTIRSAGGKDVDFAMLAASYRY